MCLPCYHHNGFVATHAFGHMMYGYTLLVPMKQRDLSSLCVVDHIWPLILYSYDNHTVVGWYITYTPRRYPSMVEISIHIYMPSSNINTVPINVNLYSQ